MCFIDGKLDKGLGEGLGMRLRWVELSWPVALGANFA